MIDRAAMMIAAMRAQAAPVNRPIEMQNADDAEDEVDPSPGGEVELVGVLRADNEELVIDQGGNALENTENGHDEQQDCDGKHCSAGNSLPAGEGLLDGVTV